MNENKTNKMNFISKLFKRNKEIRGVIIASDLEGDILNSSICPGAKSLRRLSKSGRRKFIGWMSSYGTLGNTTYFSYDENYEPKNMMEAQVGDVVIFKKKRK